jgi:hypothetical protein
MSKLWLNLVNQVSHQVNIYGFLVHLFYVKLLKVFFQSNCAEGSQKYVLWFNKLNIWVLHLDLFVKLTSFFDNLNAVF